MIPMPTSGRRSSWTGHTQHVPSTRYANTHSDVPSRRFPENTQEINSTNTSVTVNKCSGSRRSDKSYQVYDNPEIYSSFSIQSCCSRAPETPPEIPYSSRILCLGRLSAGHPVVYNADGWVPDQGISGATGANVASPALKACGESASTILAGSLSWMQKRIYKSSFLLLWF